MDHKQTRWTFEDTLSQIGLGYVPLFLLGFTKQRWQWLALAVILVGYWGAFALYEPPVNFDYQEVGVAADWPYHYSGLASHWNKNSNLAWGFDQWFLNLFPREKPFTHNGGGYATLSFIPTLGTMILGLIAGGWLRLEEAPWKKIGSFVAVRRPLARTGPGGARKRPLPVRQANLDAVLDALQRRLVLPVAGVFLHVHRRHRLDVLELSAAGDRREFDRAYLLAHGPGPVHPPLVPHSFRPTDL